MEIDEQGMNDHARQLLGFYHKSNAFGIANELKFTLIERGHVEYTMEIKPEHLSTPIAAHGGAISGLMDAILGVAALSHTANDLRVVGTVEFKIQFLRPILLGDNLRGIGKVDHAGKRLLMVTGDIWCTNKNELVAKGSGTMTSYPYEHAKLGTVKS
jgi:uncharacterized protein (TIGR00369 family)